MPENIITTLNSTKIQTETFFGLPEMDWQKTYGVGKWNIKKMLVHLADAETVLHERIKRVIAGPEQVIWAFDQERWCENLRYADFPLTISKALFTANRNSIIYLAEQFYQSKGHQTFVHSETGIRTLKDEFDKVASHNLGHLQQIEQSLQTT
jgi:DinB superfamily